MSKAQPVVKEPNFLVRFYRETVGELRKVVWPTWPEARNLTLVVLSVITLGSIFLGFFDWLFAEGFRLLVSLAQ
ncbi:MAG: preprotein translocase subunit SecE [Anaerolineales bacterium]|nr:preprotein translocase subunit SecE [Anaerolineales bacterium]